jgi:hypothetical protein
VHWVQPKIVVEVTYLTGRKTTRCDRRPRRRFSWSVLLDTVLERLRLRNECHMDHARALPSGEGERLASPLMRRIAALGELTLVVARYMPWATPFSNASLAAPLVHGHERGL